jgi:hypothetical protein
MIAPNRRLWRHGMVAGLAAFVCIGAGIAQTPDPMHGTWKLDVAKSKYSPGPAPKSSTLNIEAAGTGRKVSVETVAADGTAITWGYTGNFDGKDIPITGTNPDADTIVLRRLSPTSTQTVWKKDGKVTITNTLTVSPDGQTLTIVSTGTNAKGQKVNNTQVFERQKTS